MARAGRLLRMGQRLDVRGAAACGICSHRTDAHRELQFSRLELRDGEIVEIRNPEYKAGHFHCSVDDCDCVMVVF